MKSALAIIGLSVAVSIGCSATPSASSPAQASPAQTTAAAFTPQPSATLAAQSSQEQSACTLKLSEAPVINGLKLGMTVDEILALFSGSKDDRELRAQLAKPPTQIGTSSFVVRPSKYENKADFAGISQITVSLLDGRVLRFHIGYDGPEWPHVDKFVEQFRKGKDLPSVEEWKAFTGLDTQLKTLTCEGFEIRVFAGGEGGSVNYVLLQDREGDRKLRERARTVRE